MKKLKWILPLALIATIAYAASVERIKKDILLIGSKTSTAVKQILMEYGNGTQGGIQLDPVRNKVQFSHDGVTFRDIGSGGGAGGGENFNNAFTTDDNPNAEDGTTGWTVSAGAFAVTATDPLEGDQSFTWTPAAQNDTLDSPVLDVNRDIFKEKSCEARITYIGGDENLTLKVLNGDDEELGSEELMASSISVQQSVFFICPSDADIVADSDKGDLRLRIENTGASASALIKWDQSYLGTLRGLTETTLPDIFSAYLIKGTLTVADETGDVVTGISSGGSGIINVSFQGLTATPNCSALGQSGSDMRIRQNGVSNTGLTLYTYNSAGNLEDRNVRITCHKTGADAKQTVQVYKSIPKISENLNNFGADINEDVINSQSSNWISNVTKNSTGNYTINFVAGTFSVVPYCSIKAFNSNAVFQYAYNGSGTSITVDSNNSTGASTDSRYILNCMRQDIKNPIVQPVIVGQVSNSYAEKSVTNVRVESCFIEVDLNGGTPVTQNDLCDHWVDSITDNGTGNMTVNFVPGTFSKPPVCTCNATGNADCSQTNIPSITSAISLRTRESASATLIDNRAFLICQGEK